jgi:hypothetical protein
MPTRRRNGGSSGAEAGVQTRVKSAKIVVANKAIAETEQHHPLHKQAKSGFVSGHVRSPRSGAAQLKRNRYGLILLCFVADRLASGERQKET